MVRNQELNGPTEHLSPSVLDRHVGRDYRAWAPIIGIDAGLIV